MGSRTIPTECEHGKVIDWGDFGPDSDDSSVGVEPCHECDPIDDATYSLRLLRSRLVKESEQLARQIAALDAAVEALAGGSA